jgi:shikimate kinase
MSDDLLTVQYKMKKPIVLVGMMGAGKSRIGYELSKVLDMPLLDSDREVEKAARYSVAEIFDIFGEDAFRDAERRVIRRLVEEEGGQRIIATGGGAIINPETIKRLNDHSYCIWLKASQEILLERVTRNDKRPLLQSGNPEDILQNLIETRQDMYQSASRKTVDVLNNSVDDTLKLVLNAVSDCIKEDEREEKRHHG